MGRSSKWIEMLGMPPLRQHWQQVNRAERAAQAELRARRKARDNTRAKCTCDAYKFPHRPGGGLCRYPDSPAVRWQEAQATEIAERVAIFRERCGEPTTEQMVDLVALTTRPYRPYRKRYAGIVRQIARANGLHPIRDRAAIESIMPRVLDLAKQLHRQHPKYKYRNMEITETGIRGYWTTAGPTM
jgi:hypothetical protein